MAAFTDSEAEAFLDSDRSDELNIDLNVISGHAHFYTLVKSDGTGNVGGAEIELGTIVGEEGSVTSALFLGQNVNLAAEFGVGMNGIGFGKNLAALDLVALYAAEKSTDVITSHSLVKGLTEHFETGANDLSLFLGKTDNFNFLADLEGAALNTTGSNGTTAGDGHNVLNRHKEGLIGFTIGSGDELVNSLHELNDALSLGGICGVVSVVLESLKSGTADDGGIIAGEVILVEGLADLHLYEIEKLGIGRLGGKRLAHSYAWGDMERLGLHMAFGTDCPVECFHPLEGVYCAVTRRDFTGNGPFLPEQALTPYQALYAYTAGGAYASGEERIKGRIRSGLLADFLLVDRNLLTCPPEELLSARVLRTYVGGACVFRDPSF